MWQAIRNKNYVHEDIVNKLIMASAQMRFSPDYFGLSAFCTKNRDKMLPNSASYLKVYCSMTDLTLRLPD